ncbi:MAG: carbohydrate kinase [Gemmataceae bacterium]|nr:carbohydrate kinase [Gemmataceae bacterium]
MPIEILGVGEVLWDMLPTGRALGGAPANFVFHCRRLGHEAVLVSRVGTDPLGEELRAALAERGLDTSLVQQDDAHPTGTVDVALVGGQPAYTIHENVAWDFLQPDDGLDALLANALVVCFGTLMQRHPASRAAVQRLVRMASQQALVVCDINLRQEYWSAEVLEHSLRLSRWAKLNDDELSKLSALFGLSGSTESERLLAMRRRFGLELAALTRGARGALVQTDDEEATVAGERVEVADTVGAGDAFTAGLACGVLEGMEIADAARLANRYAARVAGAVGGMPQVERPT